MTRVSVVGRIVLCSLFALRLSASTISLSSASVVVALGSQAVETLSVSGLGGGAALGTYDLNIAFDPAILSFKNAAFGTGLDVLGLGDIQSTTPGVGTVEFFELSLDSSSDLLSLQPSVFTLATLTFDTLAVGISPLTITVNAIGDQDGNSLSPNLQNGSVTVTGGSTATPEPRTFWVMALGLTGFIFVKRRKTGRA